MGIGHLLHNLAWSFQQGKLHELFLHDGITFGTWGLVLVTLLLVLDSWRSGKDQQRRWNDEDKQRADDRAELRSRWDRDDAIRREENKPKYAFGIALNDEVGCHLWISNLGVTSFLVRTVFLNRRLFGGVDFDSAPGEWNEVITPGSKCIFKFGKALFWNETLRETNKQTIALECQARCSIVSFDENATVSAMKEFRMYADTQTGLLRLARTTEY